MAKKIMGKFSRIKKIFKKKEKVEKKPVVDKIIEEHKESSKVLKAINSRFKEELQSANALNIFDELLDYSQSIVDYREFNSKRFLECFRNRDGRVLKKTPHYILQYLRSPTQKGIDLSLTLITTRGASNYLVRLVSLKSAKENAIRESSIVKKKYALLLEQLGVKTIKAEFSLFDPIKKIDLSVYPNFEIREAAIPTDSEKQRFIDSIDQRYKQLIKKKTELKDTQLVDLSVIGTTPLPIYKITKDSSRYKEGELIVDTRVN
jgi:hypothetical protein